MVMNKSNNSEQMSTSLKKTLELSLIPNILSELKEGNSKKAIQLVDDFYRDHAEENISEDIRNTCDAFKASALEQNENFFEALEIRKKLNLSTDRNTILYLYQKIDIVRNLLNLNQLEDAAREVENAISQGDSNLSNPIGMLKILFMYMQIKERLNTFIPKQYEQLIKNIAQFLEIDTSDIFSSGTSDQTHAAISRIFNRQKEANKRYQALVLALDSAIDGDEQDELIEQFIENEEVGYYRKRAEEIFDE
jgi:hypothetical protein